MIRKKMIAPIVLTAALASLLIADMAQAQGKKPGGFGQERPSFTELDTDGDGNLTIAEMLARTNDRFGESDANGDGVLTSDEVIASASAKAAERAELRFARLLEWRDSDGDGALSQSELGDNRAEKMFARVDADHDGVVTLEEYEQALAQGSRHGRRQRGGNFNQRGG